MMPNADLQRVSVWCGRGSTREMQARARRRTNLNLGAHALPISHALPAEPTRNSRVDLLPLRHFRSGSLYGGRLSLHLGRLRAPAQRDALERTKDTQGGVGEALNLALERRDDDVLTEAVEDAAVVLWHSRLGISWRERDGSL